MWYIWEHTLRCRGWGWLKNSVWDSILSFHHVGSGPNSGLAANVTHWAVSVAPELILVSHSFICLESSLLLVCLFCQERIPSTWLLRPNRHSSSSLDSGGSKGARLGPKSPWKDSSSFPESMGQVLSLGPIQTSWVFPRSLPPFHCQDGSKFSMPFPPPWASQDLQAKGQHPTTSGSREGGLNPRHHQKQKSVRTFEFEPLKIRHFCHHQPRVRMFPEPTWDRPAAVNPLLHSLSGWSDP